MANPVDEYLKLRKTSAVKVNPEILAAIREGTAQAMKGQKGFWPEMGRSAGQLGVVAGGVGIYHAAKKTIQAVSKRRDFDEMMRSNPDLRQMHRDNPIQFNRHYSSLRALNPEFAAEPTVAGTYMRQMALNPDSAGKVIVESVGARRGIAPEVSYGVQRGGPQVGFKQ